MGHDVNNGRIGIKLQNDKHAMIRDNNENGKYDQGDEIVIIDMKKGEILSDTPFRKSTAGGAKLYNDKNKHSIFIHNEDGSNNMYKVDDAYYNTLKTKINSDKATKKEIQEYNAFKNIGFENIG